MGYRLNKVFFEVDRVATVNKMRSAGASDGDFMERVAMCVNSYAHVSGFNSDAVCVAMRTLSSGVVELEVSGDRPISDMKAGMETTARKHGVEFSRRREEGTV